MSDFFAAARITMMQGVLAGLAVFTLAGLSGCAGTSADGDGPAMAVPAAMNVTGDSAFCLDLANRIKNLEVAGIPQKLAQSSRTKVPLATGDQTAARDYLTATETHMFKCGASGAADATSGIVAPPKAP